MANRHLLSLQNITIFVIGLHYFNVGNIYSTIANTAFHVPVLLALILFIDRPLPFLAFTWKVIAGFDF